MSEINSPPIFERFVRKRKESRPFRIVTDLVISATPAGPAIVNELFVGSARINHAEKDRSADTSPFTGIPDVLETNIYRTLELVRNLTLFFGLGLGLSSHEFASLASALVIYSTMGIICSELVSQRMDRYYKSQ